MYRKFLAMPALRHTCDDHHYDSDSFPIMLDNRASKCLTNCLEDFIKPPKKARVQIKGIGGAKVEATWKGTVKWAFEDNEGKVHSFTIPDTYYSLNIPGRILSLQHWAQEANDNTPLPRGTFSATYDDCVEMYWQQQKYSRTVPYDSSTNAATIRSAPGYSAFAAYCAEVSDDDPLHCYNSPFVSDDEDSEDDDEDELQPPREYIADPGMPKATTPTGKPDVSGKPAEDDKTDFSLDGPDEPAIIEDEEVNFSDLQNELMHWHYRLGHLTYRKLRLLAESGDIPYRLRKARPFRCSACMYAKATKRPWRTKAPTNERSVPPVMRAGDCVSVDQLESKTPGFVGQLKAPTLTKTRYQVATVFVDQFSRLSFVYLQYSTSAAETVKAKDAFEEFAESHGVRVKHYHADNGRFAENLFRAACDKKNQTQSFCGVNAHWQNGLAERHIRVHQEMARTMLLHAKRRWPKAVETYLWPYALRMASDILRHTPRFDGKIPMALFSQANVAPAKRHFHPFASPVYVLDSEMQQGKGYSKRKWTERARVGLYLGPSPQHARSVHLVLNLQTGFVSPQFHVSFDDHFETTRGGAADLLPKPLWQIRAHFVDGAGNTIKPKANERKNPKASKLADASKTTTGTN
jgi:hypothetical protein